MAATALPSAMPAVISGSVAASSEPKTSSSTTSAAAAPKPTLFTLPWLAAFATWPWTSTWTPLPAPDSAALTNASASFFVTPIACLPSVTFANATRPDSAICAAPAGANGDATEATVGSPATFSSIASIWLRTAGSVTLPSSTANTICSRSPAALGATF